jgi:hypothetical protein
MGRRFSRIKDASRLAGAVDNYISYITNAATRPRRVGQGPAREPQIDLAIEPFTISIPSGEGFLARAGTSARTLMDAGVGTAAVPVSGSVDARKVSGWSPARIVMFVGTGTSAVRTSAITQLPYLKQNGRSYSHPFGKSVATDTEMDKFAAIRSLLAGNNRRFSIKSETYKQR